METVPIHRAGMLLSLRDVERQENLSTLPGKKRKKQISRCTRVVKNILLYSCGLRCLRHKLRPTGLDRDTTRAHARKNAQTSHIGHHPVATDTKLRTLSMSTPASYEYDGSGRILDQKDLRKRGKTY